jgi:hypothetical protein
LVQVVPHIARLGPQVDASASALASLAAIVFASGLVFASVSTGASSAVASTAAIVLASVPEFASMSEFASVSELASFPESDPPELLPHPVAASVATKAAKQVRCVARRPIAEPFRTYMSVPPALDPRHITSRSASCVRRERSQDRSPDAISRLSPSQRLCAQDGRA